MLWAVDPSMVWFGALLISELETACMRIQKGYKINFMNSLVVLKGSSFLIPSLNVFLCVASHKIL